MNTRYATRLVVLSALVTTLGSAAYAQGTQTTKPFEPTVGQPGKDVVWVPTPEATVAKMLDMAKVTPQDYLMDLGSGDGRTVIAAAKRGLTAKGIEYNENMVDLAKRNANAAGVAAKATFEKADIFETDFSKANVITLFLLPQLNLRLRPTILNMKPGTRIVSNTFTMDDWQPDQTETVSDCTSWCTALLWIVPAKVEGTWQLAGNDLVLDQDFQNFTGKLGSNVVTQGKLNGADISFTVGNQKYTGKVDGNSMSGTITGGSGGSWKATKR
ncbi:MAG TPA: methyltransferase domain-containing protein [Vicinamibacterales bacterium]|nr:methyltransferase domain-containing protein [Vicinamibacterales bacterium]